MTWRVARCLLVLRDQIDAAWPNRNKASDGTIGDAAHQASVSDHNPDPWGVVRALDITHDPTHGCDIDRLSDVLAASRDPRIYYMIANRLITGPAYGWQWTEYGGDDPHTNHIHISVCGSTQDDTRPWSIGATGGEDMAGETADFVAAHVPEIGPDGKATGAEIGLHVATASIQSTATHALLELRALAARPSAPVTLTAGQMGMLAAGLAEALTPALQAAAEAAVRRVLGGLDEGAIA